MNTTIIFGEILSALSALCLAYSTFSKTKKNMVLWQAGNAAFYLVSNIFLGGYSAVAVNALTILRNLLASKERLHKWMTGLICLAMIIIGVAFNNRGYLGILPITASVSYTILMYIVKDIQAMRLAVISNMAQWMIFDGLIGAYPSFIMDIVIIVLTARNFLVRRQTN